MIDYATILLEAKQHLKAFEEAMLYRRYKEAAHHANDLAAEARLLVHLAREST